MKKNFHEQMFEEWGFVGEEIKISAAMATALSLLAFGKAESYRVEAQITDHFPSIATEMRDYYQMMSDYLDFLLRQVPEK